MLLLTDTWTPAETENPVKTGGEDLVIDPTLWQNWTLTGNVKPRPLLSNGKNRKQKQFVASVSDRQYWSRTGEAYSCQFLYGRDQKIRGGALALADATSQTVWAVPGLQASAAWQHWRPQQWHGGTAPSSSCRSGTGRSLGTGTAGLVARKRWWGSQTRRPVPPVERPSPCHRGGRQWCQAHGLATRGNHRSWPRLCHQHRRCDRQEATPWTQT